MKVERKWLFYCTIGGILMIIGTTSGLRIFTFLIGLYFTWGEPYLAISIGQELTFIISIFLTVLLFIMSAGGISVLIGTFLVAVHIHKLGKFIISIGTGMGIAGLMFFYIWGASQIQDNTWQNLIIYTLLLFIDPFFVGVLFSLIGRRKMRPISEEEQDKQFQEPIIPHYASGDDPDAKIRFCPVCNTENLEPNRFCRKCGSNLTQSTAYAL